MSEGPDYEDYDPQHPDLQHEQPPVESTGDPADSEPPEGTEDDPGDVPVQIPDPPPGELGEGLPEAVPPPPPAEPYLTQEQAEQGDV